MNIRTACQCFSICSVLALQMGCTNVSTHRAQERRSACRAPLAVGLGVAAGIGFLGGFAAYSSFSSMESCDNSDPYDNCTGYEGLGGMMAGVGYSVLALGGMAMSVGLGIEAENTCREALTARSPVSSDSSSIVYQRWLEKQRIHESAINPALAGKPDDDGISRAHLKSSSSVQE